MDAGTKEMLERGAKMQITIYGTPFKEPECLGCPHYSKCKGEYYARKRRQKQNGEQAQIR